MLASSARSCATGRALQMPGLNRRRTTPWFAAPEFADLAAIADFNGDRYAIPALSAEDVALAPAAALLAKRSCSFAEWFSFSAPGSGLRSYIDASGQWGTDLPPHAARFDWSNGRRQLALNESAANLVTNSRGVGAAAGTPGVLPAGWFAQAAGLSIGVTRTGTEDGLPYVDIRYRGVTSANFGNAVFGNVSGVVPGSGHSLSAYLSLVAGTATAINLASLRFRYTLAEGGSVDVATAFPLVAGALKQARVAATDTVAAGANGSGIIFVQFNWSVGVSVDFTIRVALPQLEVGPFASPAIPTASGTLVRPAETAALGAVAAALLRRPAASVVIRGQSMLRAGGVLIGLPGSGALLRSSATRTQAIADGAAALASGSGVDFGVSNWGVGLAFDATGRSLARNGAGAAGDARSPPADRSGIWLGRSGAGGAAADGFYDWIGIAPTRLANPRLIQLCTPA